MELLPKELEDTLPKLYETEKIPTKEKILYVRYISIFSNWEWYLCEYDSNKKLAFGYVQGHEKEWGYFSLIEFQDINNNNLMIIRDESFTPIKFKELKNERVKCTTARVTK